MYGSTHLDLGRYTLSSPSTTATLTTANSTPLSSNLDGSLMLDPSCMESLFALCDNPTTGKTDQSVTESGGPKAGNPQVPGLSLPTPTTGNGRGAKRGRPPASNSDRDADDADPDIIVKRQRNNIAAKKYRQKKLDRIEELEEEVDGIKKERDELRIRLARQEAETAALREMLKMATAAQK